MEAPGQQVVVLSKVLASDVNAGYQELANVQVWGGASSCTCAARRCYAAPLRANTRLRCARFAASQAHGSY